MAKEDPGGVTGKLAFNGAHCVTCGKPTTQGFECRDCRAIRSARPIVQARSDENETHRRSNFREIGGIVAAIAICMLILSILDQLPSRRISSPPPVRRAVSSLPPRPATIFPPRYPQVQPRSQAAPVNPPIVCRQPPPQDVAPSGKGVASAEQFESEFQQEYRRDTQNQQAQSWDEYRSWVGKFYSGAFGVQGWMETGNEILRHVSGSRYDSIRQKWDRLGVILGKEWSKDNGVRRIDTGALNSLSSDLQDAASRDSGDGSVIEDSLDKALQWASRATGS